MKITITIETETLQKAKELGLNISRVCEMALKHYINALITANKQLSEFTESNLKMPNNLGSTNKFDWSEFEKFLNRDHTTRVCRDMLRYAQKYQHCIHQKDLKPITLLSVGKRRMVMAALSAYAKFSGFHEDWKALVKQYGLTWSGKKDDVLIARFTKIKDPNEVFEYIKQVKNAQPKLAPFIEFMAITGLRLTEAVDAYNLIREKDTQYYNAEKQILEHYKYKDIFLRKGKKAFISFVPPDIIKRIKNSEPLKSKYSIQKAINKKNLKARFSDIREAHASYLTKYLRPSEIDFLQGRISATVFMQNYFNPALIADLKLRAFKAMREIQANI